VPVAEESAVPALVRSAALLVAVRVAVRASEPAGWDGWAAELDGWAAEARRCDCGQPSSSAVTSAAARSTPTATGRRPYQGRTGIGRTARCLPACLPLAGSSGELADQCRLAARRQCNQPAAACLRCNQPATRRHQCGQPAAGSWCRSLLPARSRSIVAMSAGGRGRATTVRSAGTKRRAVDAG